jgi:hypothetical protein
MCYGVFPVDILGSLTEIYDFTVFMETKLKINVVVDAADKLISLLSVSERYTELGFQPVKGDLLTIVAEHVGDFQPEHGELQINSKASCLLEVYKRELNPAMKQLDVFCSLRK